MVKVGSQARNNKEVRDIIKDSKKIDTNQYLLTDRLNNIIVVDIEEGNVYYYDDETDELTPANTAEQSKKQNGYLYVEIVIFNENNVPIVINYAQHSLIAMLAHTSDYDNLVEKGKTPIVNHKDNCPWSNNSKNLEWTTTKWNTLHGKVVHSLYHSDYSDTFTEVRHNKSEVDFICLKTILSVKLIESYEDEIKKLGFKSLKQFWGLKKNTDVISSDDIANFLSWLNNN